MKNNSPPPPPAGGPSVWVCARVLFLPRAFAETGTCSSHCKQPVIRRDLMAVHVEKVATLLIDKGCNADLPEGIKPLLITSGD